jgi:hypothetical protein
MCQYQPPKICVWFISALRTSLTCHDDDGKPFLYMVAGDFIGECCHLWEEVLLVRQYVAGPGKWLHRVNYRLDGGECPCTLLLPLMLHPGIYLPEVGRFHRHHPHFCNTRSNNPKPSSSIPCVERQQHEPSGQRASNSAHVQAAQHHHR